MSDHPADPSSESSNRQAIRLPQVSAESHADKVAREKLGRPIADLVFSAPAAVPVNPDLPRDQQALERKVIAELQTIFDPEIPLNIYDLGLIYRIEISPANAVTVDMTLTAPACPVADSIVREVQRKLSAIPEVPVAKVNLVWDPPWTRDRLSDAAKLALGLL